MGKQHGSKVSEAFCDEQNVQRTRRRGKRIMVLASPHWDQIPNTQNLKGEEEVILAYGFSWFSLWSVGSITLLAGRKGMAEGQLPTSWNQEAERQEELGSEHTLLGHGPVAIPSQKPSPTSTSSCALSASVVESPSKVCPTSEFVRL